MKVSQDATACGRFDVHKIGLDPGVHTIVTAPLGQIGSGRNSGFQALNLAVQFGAKRIVLVGYDMNVERGEHWHGRHSNLSNPRANVIARWRDIMDANAPKLAKLGVEVINASKHSALTAYPKMSLNAALERFESCRAQPA